MLRLYGAEIVESPGAEGSNGAVRLALQMAESDSRWFMPFQYANEANPRAHYEGTGAEIADALDRVDVFVAGLGTGGHADGSGRTPARELSGSRDRRCRTAPGRPGHGPPLPRGRATSRRSSTSPSSTASSSSRTARPSRRCGGCSTRRASSPVSPRERSSMSPCAWDGSSTRESSSSCSPTAAGATCRPTSGRPPTPRSKSRWRRTSGGDSGCRAGRRRGARAGGGAERGLRADRAAGRRGRSATSAGETGSSRPTASSSTSIRSSGSSRTRATSSRSSTPIQRRRRSRREPTSNASGCGPGDRS